jgi:ABC-type transporter Mla subunit MlaD
MRSDSDTSETASHSPTRSTANSTRPTADDAAPLTKQQAQNQAHVIQQVEQHSAAMKKIADLLEIATVPGALENDPELLSHARQAAEEIRHQLEQLPTSTEELGDNTIPEENVLQPGEYLEIFHPDISKHREQMEATLEQLNLPPAEMISPSTELSP